MEHAHIMTDFPSSDLSQDLYPGFVIDSDEVDAKLPRLRMKGTPAFTGRDMEEIEEHYGKGISDLSVMQMQTASAFVYLRRALGRDVTWEEAAGLLVEIATEEAPDPTGSGNSATSPPSATTGG
jgi:hypothetical protein